MRWYSTRSQPNKHSSKKRRSLAYAVSKWKCFSGETDQGEQDEIPSIIFRYIRLCTDRQKKMELTSTSMLKISNAKASAFSGKNLRKLQGLCSRSKLSCQKRATVKGSFFLGYNFRILDTLIWKKLQNLAMNIG